MPDRARLSGEQFNLLEIMENMKNDRPEPNRAGASDNAVDARYGMDFDAFHEAT